MMNSLLASVSYAAMAAGGGGLTAIPNFDPVTSMPAMYPNGFYFEADETNCYTDSSLTTAVTTDGDTVQGWANEDGTRGDANQPTGANSPTFKTDSGDYLNFDAANSEHLETSETMNSEQGTLFVRFRKSTLMYAATEVMLGSANASDRCWISLTQNGSKALLSAGIADIGSNFFNQGADGIDLNDSTWHTACVTYDRGNEIVLYLDGKFILRDDLSATAAISNNGAYIGARHTGSGAIDLPFRGDISHAYMINGKALSPWEIEGFHNLTMGTSSNYPDQTNFLDMTATLIDSAYSSTGAAVTLNLDATPEGKYILVGGGQDSGSPPAGSAPTGTTNFQTLALMNEGSFDGVSFHFFEVGAGAGITTIDTWSWIYRVGWALYKVSNFDVDNSEYHLAIVGDTAQDRSIWLPPTGFWILCGTNRDHPDTASYQFEDFDITNPEFVGDNSDFYSWTHHYNATDWVQKKINTTNATPNRDLMGVIRFLPPPVVQNDGGSHRYWRIKCDDGSNTSNYGIAEIEMRTALSGADQTGTGYPIAGGERSGFEKEKAFDDISGDASNNCWSYDRSNAKSKSWIGIDFVTPVKILEVTLTSRDDSFYTQCPTDFRVQYSDDMIHWFTVETVTGESIWSQNETRTYNGW